jgi:hypothetical protein
LASDHFSTSLGAVRDSLCVQWHPSNVGSTRHIPFLLLPSYLKSRTSPCPVATLFFMGDLPFAVSVNMGSPLPNATHLLGLRSTGDRQSGRKTKLRSNSWSRKVYPDTRLLSWPGSMSGRGTSRRRILTDSNTKALSEKDKKDPKDPCKLVIPSKLPTSSISTSPQTLSNHATTSRVLNGRTFDNGTKCMDLEKQNSMLELKWPKYDHVGGRATGRTKYRNY